jgi:chromosomal replication initiation ATPase DnaA
MQAIGNFIKISKPNTRIKYIEAKDFGRVIHEAMIKKNTMVELENFKDMFSSFDVLLIDDIQFIQT